MLVVQVLKLLLKVLPLLEKYLRYLTGVNWPILTPCGLSALYEVSELFEVLGDNPLLEKLPVLKTGSVDLFHVFIVQDVALNAYPLNFVVLGDKLSQDEAGFVTHVDVLH